MHILRIADVSDNRTGGVSRAMYLTGDEIERRGHQVTYLFSPQLQPKGPARLRRFTLPLLIPRLVRQLMAQGQRFDVIEIHEPLAAAYCLARRFRRSLPPVVAFSHGLEERGWAAEIAYRRMRGLPVSLKLRISPRTQIEQSKYSVRHADHVLCCNEEDRQYLARQGVPLSRLTRHHNGVSDSFLAACAVPPPNRRHAVLFVGSWLLRKGKLEMQRAVTQLLRNHADATFTAAGIGVDEATVLADFEPEIRSRVTVVRQVTSDTRLVQLYQDHSIFLLPSYFEGQPLVLIEAAAARLAIITTGVCGMLDFVSDGVNGRLIRVGDEDGLARVLEELWNDPCQCLRLGAAARTTATQHNWADASSRILAAYEQAIAHPY
jgi:glycosyltransferase involved in cell wall biosynthesis